MGGWGPKRMVTKKNAKAKRLVAQPKPNKRRKSNKKK